MCPQTGAHFRFEDLCAKLQSILKQSSDLSLPLINSPRSDQPNRLNGEDTFRIRVV